MTDAEEKGRTIAEVQARNALLAFAEDILDWIADEPERFFGEEISEELAPMMAEHGLLVREPYDPKKHGEEPPYGVEEGDEVWWLTEKARAAARSAVQRVRTAK